MKRKVFFIVSLLMAISFGAISLDSFLWHDYQNGLLSLIPFLFAGIACERVGRSI